MKKILVIPHHPDIKDIKIRLIEIAKYLSDNHNVYLLDWTGTEKERNLKERILSSIKDLFRRTTIYNDNGLNRINIPNLHRPLFLVHSFNSYFLNKVVEKEQFDIIINGSFYQFPIKIKDKKFTYIYDIADLPSSGKKGSFDYFIEQKTKEEIQKADAVTVISNEMVDYVKEQYGLEANFVPNGADLKKIRSVSETETANIRKKYGLVDKWVIGYVGFIGSWVNVDLVVKSFKLMKKDIAEAVLLWIGLSPNLEELKQKYASEDIIFTGGISGDIEPYFNVLDIGLMCHRECPFQDKAFHLKVIEYTASKKFIVSAKLKETQRLGFPNIIFTSENVDDWARALKIAREMKWESQWDGLVKSYDWKNIVEKFIRISDSI